VPYICTAAYTTLFKTECSHDSFSVYEYDYVISSVHECRFTDVAIKYFRIVMLQWYSFSVNENGSENFGLRTAGLAY
jgi:hypothetical protein